MDGKNAKRSDDITPEMWATVNSENREMVEEYLANQAELAIKTKISYESALKIFFYWVKENLKDKSYLEIKKKELLKYSQSLQMMRLYWFLQVLTDSI